MGRNNAWRFVIQFGRIPMYTLERLANEVIQCAKAKDLMVCTAESCSAGKLAMVLSKAEGASMNFMGGMVAYTKETKTRLLAVPSDLIQRDTAVSAKVAEAWHLAQFSSLMQIWGYR